MRLAVRSHVQRLLEAAPSLPRGESRLGAAVEVAFVHDAIYGIPRMPLVLSPRTGAEDGASAIEAFRDDLVVWLSVLWAGLPVVVILGVVFPRGTRRSGRGRLVVSPSSPSSMSYVLGSSGLTKTPSEGLHSTFGCPTGSRGSPGPTTRGRSGVSAVRVGTPRPRVQFFQGSPLGRSG